MHRNGERTSMRMQLVKAFMIWVMSFVVRVTSEPVWNLSMFAKEND